MYMDLNDERAARDVQRGLVQQVLPEQQDLLVQQVFIMLLLQH